MRENVLRVEYMERKPFRYQNLVRSFPFFAWIQYSILVTASPNKDIIGTGCLLFDRPLRKLSMKTPTESR